MEAADPGARQSTSTSANNSDTRQTTPQHPYPPQAYREPPERSHHELPAMATATVLQPGSAYPPPSSYPSSYLPPSSSMTPGAEPRRNPEEKETSSRQSLPSISEVISKTATYSAPAPPPAAQQPSSSFPSPFSGPPRSYGEADKHASPQGPPPGPPFGARRDPLPSFGDSPRTGFNGRPGLPALPDRRSSPSIKNEYTPYAHDAHKDPRATNGAYPHPAAAAPPPSNSYPSGPLPQGQMPLPSYPPSPRHGPPQTYTGYDQRGGQQNHREDAEMGTRPPFEAPIYSSPWSYGEVLGRLAQSARTTFEFAEAYGRIAHEQHGAQPIPERLPTEQEVTDMISNNEMQRAALERMREVIAQSIRTERAREPPKPKPTYQEEQDVPMFEDGSKAHYNITEVKKRRGRAAPPGRCHSCNRVDTPEWRRGPDGARTLCNACGLHYAKLERKRQLEQRNIRPKPEERN